MSQRTERSTEKRNPKIGLKLQHLMSTFENLEEHKTAVNHKSLSQAISEITPQALEKSNAQAAMSDASLKEQDLGAATGTALIPRLVDFLALRVKRECPYVDVCYFCIFFR